MEHVNHVRPSRTSVLRRLAVLALAVGALTALLAPAAGAASTTATEISTAKNSKLGTILVSGNTVYVIKTSKAGCTGKCAKTWAPVVLPSGVTKPTAGSGVDTAKLGTSSTADGALQITYDGSPLYWNLKDKAPGQVHGNVSDKFAKWSVIVTEKASSGGGGNGGGNGGGSSAGTGGAAF